MLFNLFSSIVISMAISLGPIESLNDDPLLTSWVQSTGYGQGNYSDVYADIMAIYFTVRKVFINANSIPSYSIGPWNENPNVAIAQNFTISFPRFPVPALTKTATSLGVNGLFTNGVGIFNAWDARTYNTIWQTNAYIVEGVSFGRCF